MRKQSRLRPALAIVLGSGFHQALARMETEVEVPYEDLPGFPLPGVAGHAGKVLVGRLGGTAVMVLSGRSHYYEGLSMGRVTFAVRALAAAGIRDLLLTNAAGGINRRFRAGDFMVITDHINLMGTNPLRDPGTFPRGKARRRHQHGESNRFVDLTNVYDSDLRKELRAAAAACGLGIRSGVYLAVSGPSYETPAEIRAFARLGADAVGMSTVPEAIVARQCGLRVAALSCITNLAAGLGKSTLSHQEVLEMAQNAGLRGAELLEHFARRCGH